MAGLRVLAWCDYFSPSSCGGSERVAMEVYRRLADGGAEVTVVTAVPSPSQEVEEALGLRVVSVPSTDLSRLLGGQVALSPRLFARMSQIADTVQPHVMHANGLHFQTSLAAALLQRRRRLPLVTTAHIGALHFLGPGLRLPTAVHERTIGRFILRRSARAIAVGPSVADHLITLGMAGDTIDVVANGVDHRRFFPAAVAGKRPVPVVHFVGRLIANKGPHLLVDALARLRDEGVEVRAEFVGDGPLRRRLQGVVRTRSLSDSVAFVGAVTDVADRLRRTDVLVRPSLTEGMPLAVLEAMASGVCVVASAVPGNADLVRHGDNGLLFPPGDVGRLTGALRLVVQDANTRARLAAAGHRCSLAYSWDATAATTGRILARVAADGVRAR